MQSRHPVRMETCLETHWAQITTHSMGLTKIVRPNIRMGKILPTDITAMTFTATRAMQEYMEDTE